MYNIIMQIKFQSREYNKISIYISANKFKIKMYLYRYCNKRLINQKSAYFSVNGYI